MSNNEDFIDELGRKDLAIDYINLIHDLESKQVIALDAPWGSGKSTFIDLMCKRFEEDKDVYIKFNAWENDYTEEPLLSLMSDINQQFQVKEYIGTDEYKSFIPHMVRATKLFSKGALKGISKVILGNEATTDLRNAYLEVSSAITDEVANNLFKDIDESKKSRIEFKDELIKYTNKILEEKSKDKLIIIIDELDRCRPTFAIELLENIKHLFDIENVVFFIAVDKEQLSEAIKSVYGQGFDSYTYLNRFFDLELHLPKTNLINLFKNIMNHTFKNSSDYKRISDNKFLPEAIKLFNLTIRDFQRIVTEAFLLKRLRKIQKTLKDIIVNEYREIEETEISVFLLILRHKEPDVYDIIFENQSMNFTTLKNKIIETRNSMAICNFLSTYSDTLFIPSSNERILKKETKTIFDMIENNF